MHPGSQTYVSRKARHVQYIAKLLAYRIAELYRCINYYTSQYETDWPPSRVSFERVGLTVTGLQR